MVNTRPERRWAIYLQILNQLWDGTSKVSYERFARHLDRRRGRSPKVFRDRLRNPSRATYSRVWRTFCRTHRLILPRRGHLVRLLLDGLAQGRWDPEAPLQDTLPEAREFLAHHHVVPPAPTVLRRYLKTARRLSRLHRNRARDRVLAQALGTTTSPLPVVRRMRAAQGLLLFPSASQGKVGVAKLDTEDRIREQIEAALSARHHSLSTLLSHPEAEDAFSFVDRRARSTLERAEQAEVLRAWPLYLAVRHRQAVDAILFTFGRMTRILRARVQNSYDDLLDGSSRAFFERRGGELAPLRRAVLTTLEGGKPASLRRFQRLLRDLESQGKVVRSREAFLQLLATRGTFARKIVRRLRGVPLEGRDPHAKAVVRAFREVLRLAPFSEPVPSPVRAPLAFLAVPSTQMANRRVFETVVLTTLGDLLWSRRVTSPTSHRFENPWARLPPRGRHASPALLEDILPTLRQELREAWRVLGQADATSEIIRAGRLVSRRLSRKRKEEEEERLQSARRRFLAGLRPVSIVEVLTEVHRSTGMLGAFQPPRRAHHHLPGVRRVPLAVAVVLARGMNVGVVQMSSLLGHGYTLGQLRNFDEGYVTLNALRRANGILLDAWDARGLGLGWGTGEGVAADGRSFEASERSLDSGFHHRHRVSGVTVYSLVRNDWIAARVGVIGNHEWESWHLLGAMLAPHGGRSLKWATGDTHGQHLALWGLSHLLGKEIRARFRSLGRVKLYADEPSEWLPVERAERIRWRIVEDALPSLVRLADGVHKGQVTAREVLEAWNLYDEEGRNVAEALRELGKAVRTSFILRYATSEPLRREIHEGCNRAETWNSFEEAMFWGQGGRMRTNDAERREINALCMQLAMNSVIFYNAEKHGEKLRRIPGATPVTWDHIRLLGEYRITSRRSTIGGAREF